MKILPDTYFLLRLNKLKEEIIERNINQVIMLESQINRIEKIFQS